MQRTGYRKRKYYKGCWKCNKCTMVNFPERKNCFNKNCNGNQSENGRFINEQEAMNENEKLQMQKKHNLSVKTMWTCVNCSFCNKSFLEACEKCSTKKNEHKQDSIQFAKESTAKIGSGGLLVEDSLKLKNLKVPSYVYVYWYTSSKNSCKIKLNKKANAQSICNKLINVKWDDSATLDQLFRVNIFEHPLKAKKLEPKLDLFEANTINLTIPLHYRKSDVEKLLNKKACLKKNEIKSLDCSFTFVDEWQMVFRELSSHCANPKLDIKKAGSCMNNRFSRYKSCTIQFDTLKKAYECLSKINQKKIGNIVLQAQLDLVSKIVVKDVNAYMLLENELQKSKQFLQHTKFGYDIRILIPPLHTISKSIKKQGSFIQIILFGKTSDALTVCRRSFEKIITPLVVKLNDKSEFKIFQKLFNFYLEKLQKRQLEFKKILVNNDINPAVNKIYIYAISEIKDLLAKEIQKIKNVIKRVSVNVSSQFLKVFRNLNVLDLSKEVLQYLNAFNVHFESYKKDLIEIVYTDIPFLDEKSVNHKNSLFMLDPIVVLQDCTFNCWAECTNKSNSSDVWYNNKNFLVCFSNPRSTDISSSLAKEWLEKIKASQNSLNKDLGDEKKVESFSQCAICLMDIETDEEFYQLRLCSHMFHTDCFEMQIKSSISASGKRPVKCAKCAQYISLVDISANLQENEYKQFLKLCVKDYTDKKTSLYRNCPTPDCAQVIDILAGKKSCFSNDSHVFNCSECSNYYCLLCVDSNGCPTPYHFGEVCDSKKEQAKCDELFEKFMLEYRKKEDVKKCPNCKQMGDKLAGTCNRAVCAHCGTMFCWVCLWWDKNNCTDCSRVYNHLSAVHGGFY